MDDTRFDTEQVFTLNHYYYFFPEDMFPEQIEREELRSETALPCSSGAPMGYGGKF
jgi:hypothetical protein